MEAENRVVIFAKRPKPGSVKTRLTRGEIYGRTLSFKEAAEIYQAFLDDYGLRFGDCTNMDVCFCLPDREETQIEKPISTPAIEQILEPRRNGNKAKTIGEAMSFTIESQLALGFTRVLILGSDLPHLPFSVVEKAFTSLRDSDLVIGDDGGGCYLIGAAAPVPVLESTEIEWSVGKDYEKISELQRRAGRSITLMPELIHDIDSPERLQQFVEELRVSTDLASSVPNTVQCLRQLKLLP